MRSQFVTKTGVIAATVGSAVGLGNIWRFPYEAGMHGGGAFLIIYALCVLIIGIPVMVAEFSVGRGTHKNAIGAFRQLAPKSLYRFVPYMGIVASLMILSFYSVVAGWILEYLYQSVVEVFVPVTDADYALRFAGFTASWRCVMWTVVFLIINFLVLRRGIEKGIERISNVLMPFLFLILLAMCVNSLMLPDVHHGLNFIFRPDFTQVSPSVVIGAMGQAFFSLSLGLGVLMTYASYFSDKTNLVSTATITSVLDMVVAVLAGIIIFPAVFSYGMTPEAGPKLVFETLPAIFAQMPGGHLWAVAFYVLLLVASITSTISMNEISITFFIEEHGRSRQQATLINTGIAGVFGVLCALSFGVMSHVTIFGMTIFDLFDYVSSNILLPLGGLFISLFVGWRVSQDFFGHQLSGSPLIQVIRAQIRYIAPIAIIIIFIYGLL